VTETVVGCDSHPKYAVGHAKEIKLQWTAFASFVYGVTVETSLPRCQVMLIVGEKIGNKTGFCLPIDVSFA
jgi:hypothetical protein